MAGRYAGAAWAPSPNFGYPMAGGRGRQGHQPVAIVDHIESGIQSATLAWFADPKSQVSAHYSVARSGAIYQHVREDDAAWANGINPDLGEARYRSDQSIPWIADLYRGHVNANLVTLSIEHEGYSGIELTAAQYEASASLHLDLFQRYGWPVEWGRIVGHFQVNGVDRPDCPGSKFPFAKLYADLANSLYVQGRK